MITEQYQGQICGTLSCYDRLILRGTLPVWCFADGMSSFLHTPKIPIYEYTDKLANPLREQIRTNAERLAAENGIRMETCNSYKPWHDKPSGKNSLINDSGKCLHYYFYFIVFPKQSELKMLYEPLIRTALHSMKPAHIVTFPDPSEGLKKLKTVCQTVVSGDRTCQGFNLFSEEDQKRLTVMARGEFNISGFRNQSLQPFIDGKNPGPISRILKRLRLHGLIKKVGCTYKYYLTSLGKSVITLGLRLKELLVIPGLAGFKTVSF